jgi:hypothetical protein
MTQSVFSSLHRAMGESDDRLLVAYDKVLRRLFKNPFWDGGSSELRRIPWSEGKRANAEDRNTFESPGLYIWGTKRHPLYIGITRGSFRRRFKRYIWESQSQCNLAQKYGASLRSKGIAGFPPEVRNWYAKNYRGSTVRLEGAVQFAKAGIESIWFALIPHASVADIRALERKLIRIGNEWNEFHSPGLLLNKQELRTGTGQAREKRGIAKKSSANKIPKGVSRGRLGRRRASN